MGLIVPIGPISFIGMIGGIGSIGIRAVAAIRDPRIYRMGPLAQLPICLQTPKTNPALEMHVKRRANAAPPGAYSRLTQPLVRDNGVLRPATWDEALDRAADGFRRASAENGRYSTGIFSCSKSTNEVNYLASKMARQVFGNSNVDSCNRT